MQLLFPVFLTGILFCAIPLILHFLKKRPTVETPFPSFFFLEKKMIARQKKNTLMKYLILLLRCLTLTALAAAFAYPMVSASVWNPERATVLLVDTSFSMEPLREKTLHALERILRKAEKNRVLLIGLVSPDKVDWSGDFSGDGKALMRAVRERILSEGSSSFAGAIAAADHRLGTVHAKEKEILILTDGQALPWRSFDPEKKLKHTSAIRILDLAEDVRKNIWIAKVKTEVRDRQLKLTVFITNRNESAINASLQITLNGEQHTESIELRPGTQQTGILLPVDRDAGAGTIRISADAPDEIRMDNTRYFSWNGKKRTRILRTDPNADFLQEALENAVDVQIWNRNIPENTAEDCDLLLVNRIPSRSTDRIFALAGEILRKKGTVTLLWHPQPEMEELLKKFGASVRKKHLPGTRRLESISFEHPLFRSYLKTNAGSWFDILFFDVPMIRLPQDARILASFQGGAPAVAEWDCSGGRVILTAVLPCNEQTNWQTFGNFLPFWRELALYAAKPEKIPPNLTVSSARIGMPGEEIRRLPEEEKLKDRHLFHLHSAGNFRCGKTYFSVNIPEQESDLTKYSGTFDPNVLLLPGIRQRLESEYGETEQKLKHHAESNTLWRYLLAGALIFALAELLLSNRTVRS